MPTPVILICGCEKYRASLKDALTRYARPSAWDVVGCIGHPELTQPEYNADENIVYLPVSDVYEALPAKIQAAISWISTWKPDAPGIFKTDEDIFFDDLADLEETINRNTHVPYWGIVKSKTTEKGVCPSRISTRFHNKSLRPRHQTAQYCYGHGYWVSKAAISHILDAKEVYAASFMEDICTGYVLNQAGIFPEGIPLKYKERNR